MNSIIKEDIKNLVNTNLDWEKFKYTTVLITGAYGMLAQYMVHTLMYLNPRFHIRILALCRDKIKAEMIFKEYLKDPLFHIIYGDVTDKINIPDSIDYIIHTASPAGASTVNPIDIIKPNVFGTANLLQLAKDNKSKGFLFFSSGDVCGETNKEIITEDDYGPLDPTKIESCYGESKRMAENMCRCWKRGWGIPVVIVRPDHTYGPTMDLEHDKRVFAEFISNIIHGEDIVMKSDGLAVRTFTYLADATDGFFRVLLKGKPGESYNVSNNAGRMSIKDLAFKLVSMFPDKMLGVKQAESIVSKNRIRPALSTAKIEKLGYKPKYGVEEGFRRTIQSFTEEIE